MDVGSGAGLDGLIAARMVEPDGQVVGVDMTPAMLDKARASADEMRPINVEFRAGLAEALPIFSGAAQSSSAAQFGTIGITFRTRKPALHGPR